MGKRYFITGTDTDIGKTYTTVALLNYFRQKKLSTIALKPVATGEQLTGEGKRNQDALLLQANATVYLPYDQVNPILLSMPVAPHIAAAKQNRQLTVNSISKSCRAALTMPADIYLIEGAGGWCVPLNDTETMADLATALTCEIILVVGIRLGCINHALLTYQHILNSQLKLAGWIANCLVADMPFIEENIAAIANRIQAPLLSVIPLNGAIENMNSAYLLEGARA